MIYNLKILKAILSTIYFNTTLPTWYKKTPINGVNFSLEYYLVPLLVLFVVLPVLVSLTALFVEVEVALPPFLLVSVVLSV